MILILISILLTVISSVVLYVAKIKDRKILGTVTFASSFVGFICSIIVCFFQNTEIILFKITEDLVVAFKVDVVGSFFAVVISFIWVIVSVFAYKYLTIEENENKFDTYYLLSYAMLILLCFANNIITMYVTFEMVTLASMPLVMHSKSKESISAALKYLYYSLGGAFLGLLGVFFIYYYSIPGSSFTIGGTLDMNLVGSNNVFFQVVILLTLIGFGAKAGMFPLHGWLPTAHPVAPSPASAVLSGIITKAGVLAIIRLVYFSVGADYIRGSFIQYTWVSIILFTILMGSLLALIQKNMKKRFAYSSISQLSYVLLGIAMLNEQAITGSFLHVAAHACIKVCLFLTAGAIIFYTHKHDVDELAGIGKQLPITMVCYTVCALGLIGVPPTGGFFSKWFIATGSIEANLGALSYIAPVILLISAILTAGYLLPISINGFMVGDKASSYTRIKESPLMYVPLIILATTLILLGLFESPIISVIEGIF